MYFSSTIPTSENSEYDALLKIKNEHNSTWVNFNSFPLIKRTFSSWIDFSRLNDLYKTWVIWLNLNLVKIKRALNEVSIWVYLKHNRMCAHYINAPNDQGYTRIKLALITSEAGLKQSALTIRSRWNNVNDIWNNEKYIGRRFNFVHTSKKILNGL